MPQKPVLGQSLSLFVHSDSGWVYVFLPVFMETSTTGTQLVRIPSAFGSWILDWGQAEDIATLYRNT